MYRIKDWDEVYESSESRKLKSARYVCTSNKHDGKGFKRILLHPRKIELFCAWNLIIQVASKCKRRGILEDRDGPLTPDDMELKTGFPAGIFALAYEFFSSGGKLAWLEEIPGASGSFGRPRENLPESPETPADSGRPDFTPISASPGYSPESSGGSPGISRNLGTEEREEKEEREELKSARTKTAKEEFWDALKDIFELDPRTQRDEGRLYEQCMEFRLKGATVEEVKRRAAVYRAKWPDVAFTVNAVLKNWEGLRSKAPLAPARPVL